MQIRQDHNTIVTDSKYVANNAADNPHNLQGGSLTYHNISMWIRNEELLRKAGRSKVGLRWVPSHSSPDNIAQSTITKQDHIGNHLADHLNNKAEGCQFLDTAVQPIRQHIATAILIQRRLAHLIYLNTSTSQRKKTSKPKTPQPATPNYKPSSTTHAMTSTKRAPNGGATTAASQLQQQQYKKHSNPKPHVVSYTTPPSHTKGTKLHLQSRVLVGQRVLHESHLLTLGRGVYICGRCGHYA